MRLSIPHAAVALGTLILILCGPQIASANEVKYFSATDYVQGGLDLNYADLAEEFAPGLDGIPADGKALSKLPQLGGGDMITTIANPVLGSARRVDISLSGKPAMLVMFDIGQSSNSVASVNVLALYDMTNGPRLLDTMDVGLDRETSFTEPAYMELSSKFGMAFIRNSHHNAGEEYMQTSLIGIWDGKLHEVETLSSYSWMTGDGDTRVLPNFAAVKNAIAFDATFAVKTTRCEGGCMPDDGYPSTTDNITARYRWDAAKGKFVRPEHAFDKIPQANMEE